MYKLVMITPYGVTVIDGTPRHVYSTVARGAYSFAFVYNNDGKLEKAFKAKPCNPIEENFFVEG